MLGLLAGLLRLLGLRVLLGRLGLRRGQSLFTSLAFSSLFTVTARAVENVAWVSGRTDVFATLFLILAFFAFEARKTALIALCVGLALGCKEVVVGGVVALSVLAWFGTPRHLKLVGALGLSVGIYGVLRVLSGVQNIGIQLSPSDRFFTVGQAVTVTIGRKRIEDAVR